MIICLTFDLQFKTNCANKGKISGFWFKVANFLDFLPNRDGQSL